MKGFTFYISIKMVKKTVALDQYKKYIFFLDYPLLQYLLHLVGLCSIDPFSFRNSDMHFYASLANSVYLRC